MRRFCNVLQSCIGKLIKALIFENKPQKNAKKKEKKKLMINIK